MQSYYLIKFLFSDLSAFTVIPNENLSFCNLKENIQHWSVGKKTECYNFFSFVFLSLQKKEHREMTNLWNETTTLKRISSNYVTDDIYKAEEFGRFTRR